MDRDLFGPVLARYDTPDHPVLQQCLVRARGEFGLPFHDSVHRRVHRGRGGQQGADVQLPQQGELRGVEVHCLGSPGDSGNKSALYLFHRPGGQQRDAIEMETDELNRRQYEVARLHVSNSVLDNCLSTLKHETMYYPSRIRQIVDTRPIDCDALDEVTGYYKSLYDILSQQALRQTETPMRIDGEMWEMLLDILSSINQARVTWTAHTSDGQYQTVRIPVPNVKLTEQECRQLFTPSTKDVRYLMCRQIIRELGEVSQARACGIKASPAETGIEVMLVIPRNTSFFAKQQGVQSQPET